MVQTTLERVAALSSTVASLQSVLYVLSFVYVCMELDKRHTCYSKQCDVIWTPGFPNNDFPLSAILCINVPWQHENSIVSNTITARLWPQQARKPLTFYIISIHNIKKSILHLQDGGGLLSGRSGAGPPATADYLVYFCIYFVCLPAYFVFEML